MLKRQLLLGSLSAMFAFGTLAVHAEGSRKAFAKTCGGSTMIIHCSPGHANCDRNELVIRQGMTAPRALPLPHGLEDYDPVGLSCARTRDSRSYFVVEYGGASHTCASCEWHHIFSSDGKILTRSDPAFVSDPSLPGGQSRHPNSTDFIKVSKELKLPDAPMTYGN
ncbi:hypothetical protein [Luteibacter aegosomatissinici]|uniref:hypothetical protein n=1 Tax=Luteibacter aegosomatissinici TaxID=2911539 RepID=UPI001FF9DFF3|nr:hypothetical protein [Luteibacter aegosomatissinici]UPG93837.1 hypothetical protein L2Y97_18675 [Luteibacter aegosomatissinici]